MKKTIVLTSPVRSRLGSVLHQLLYFSKHKEILELIEHTYSLDKGDGYHRFTITGTTQDLVDWIAIFVEAFISIRFEMEMILEHIDSKREVNFLKLAKNEHPAYLQDYSPRGAVRK